RICGAGDAAVGDFIQNAVDRGVVAELSAGSGFYAFCDAAVQRALADTIVTFRRRGICERIAQELIAAREDGGFDDVIAENWDAAGRHLEAAEWLSRVAEGRASQLQYRAAAALYERAASHLGDLPERQLETQELAAVHYELAGAWAEAVPLRERVMTTMNRNTSDDRYLDALRSLIVDYWYTDRERGLELLASLRRAREPKARNAAVRQMIALAIYLFTSGFSKEACETVHAIDPDDVDAACQPRYQLAVAMARRSIVPPDETLRAAANAAKLSETFPGEPDAWWLWMEATNLACCLGKIEAAVECAAQAAASSARSGNAPQSAPWTALLLAEVYSIAGDVARTHDLVCSLAGISDAGELWEANAAAIYVFAGLHAGDAALVDGFFNVRYLEKALADRQPALCGMYLRSYPEIMIARGHAALLADVLNRCVDSRFVDPLFFISLAVARFGPIECAERARAEICAREGGADGAVAAAAKQLFDAYAFTRRSQKVRAKEAAAAAAVAYGRLGYSLHRAFALELRGDLEEARTLYASLGAAREATRLASPRRKESRAYFGAALTQREREVARLVSAGATNPEIARRFHLSVRTVQHHMEAIYSKLGIRARWQLADALSGQLRRKSG
ncbi:MAG TPA: helix-turn-helix transcriptional regulator, partial [Candidatus Tumulicola sp.]|nr:helix-turn-helix transcriptional regulator [Candidatus Tumulicola sp.]